jgi:hypothetical protein
MDPPGRRSISTAEAQAVLDELAQHEADLLTVEAQRADAAKRLFDLEAEMEALRAVATLWSYGDVHECPLSGSAHVADTECVTYALKHGDRAHRDAAPAGAEGAVQQIRAAAENALAHTGGEQDGYVLVQAEYVDSLRRCVAESWGHSDAE